MLAAIAPYRYLYDPAESEVTALAQELPQAHPNDYIGFLYMRAAFAYIYAQNQADIEAFISRIRYGMEWEREPDERRPTRDETIVLYAFMVERFSGSQPA